jgi:uncharacterized protein (TIGR02147 family)
MGLVFGAKSHDAYLNQKLNGPDARRGVKSQLAQHMMVQPAFLSQVLAGKYALSLEQADLANQFFDHSPEEADFFLLLVNRDRAGTATLRTHFDKQITAALAKRNQVVERLGKKFELTSEAKGVYYSSWMFAAIHVACTIPDLRTCRSLSAHFGLPALTIASVLQFLEENGLIHKENDQYLPTQNWVRLDKNSPHIVKHHSNWRQKAIQNLELQTDEDLHYSGVFSIDRASMNLIKDEILGFMKEQMKKIEKAKEEDLVVFGIDFFKLK